MAYRWWIASLSAIALSACSGNAATPPGQQGGVPVQVAEVIAEPVEITSTHTGRLEAVERVELRPRVSGYVDAVLYREGEFVEAGQTLFHIDRRPFEAAMQRARAEFEKAQFRAVLAHAEAQRAQRLVDQNAISAEEHERRQAAHAEALAQVGAALGALRTAELDLEFATVTAPIAGRAGRAMVTKGNFVTAGQQAPLTTIVATNPIHVYVDVDEASLARLAAPGNGAHSWKAHVFSADGGTPLASGPVDFADNEIARGSGTLRLRARLPNPRGALTPGMFVRVRLATGSAEQAVLVDDKAIGTDQGHRFVLVVKADQTLEYRPVTPGPLAAGLRVIEAGLQPGERIVVNGLMRVRPGALVAAQPVSMRDVAKSLTPSDLPPADVATGARDAQSS